MAQGLPSEYVNCIAPPRYDTLANKLSLLSEICEDGAGNLWLGTFGEGLSKLNPLSGEIIQIALSNRRSTWFSDKTMLVLLRFQAQSSSLSRDFALRHNFPNPFNPETEISYELPRQIF